MLLSMTSGKKVESPAAAHAPYTRSMTLAELIEKGREFAPADRVKLAHELRRRIEDIERGRVRLVDGRETMHIARAGIAERRAQPNT